VNGALANATYGNGVLALALPILASGQPSVRSEFVLEVIAATRGERVGIVAATGIRRRGRSGGRSWRSRRAAVRGLAHASVGEGRFQIAVCILNQNERERRAIMRGKS